MVELANTFETNAKGYRRFRPEYPDSIRRIIVEASALSQGARILEIGCGAGQATGLFRYLEPAQTCLDPGKKLLTSCQQRYPEYEFVCTRFEDFVSPSGPFDLIYAATSFHWLTRDVRFKRSASMLGDTGRLAVFTDRHTKNLSGFFELVQPIYERIAPDMQSPFGGSAERPETNPLRCCLETEVDRDLHYSADDYVGLLRTFSGHIALGEDRLARLCDEIHSLIETRFDGEIIKTLTTGLSIYGK